MRSTGLPTRIHLPLEIFTAVLGLVVAGLVVWTVRSWRRSRWFAYGLVASFGVALVGGIALAMLLMAGMAAAIRG